MPPVKACKEGPSKLECPEDKERFPMPDTIFLKGLEVKCIIGIFAWERRIRQKIRMDLEFPASIARAAKKDRIEDATDYKKIAKRTIAFVSNSRYQLVETLADRLASVLLKEFHLSEIRIRLAKPGAIRGAEEVGVAITRKARKRRS